MALLPCFLTLTACFGWPWMGCTCDLVWRWYFS